ncbi:MAG: hypothetical protein JSW51_00115 [Gemmatimonadota bacterium]|nr:MAG: hypothetical protein JSW51_00115 [Gemmatimonadota bacterium]
MHKVLESVTALVKAALDTDSLSGFLDAAADQVPADRSDPTAEVLADVSHMLAQLVERLEHDRRAAVRADAMLAASPLPSAVISPDGRVLQSNYAFDSLVGQGMQSASGKTLTSLGLFADTELLQAALEAGMSGQRWDGGLSVMADKDERACDAVLTSIGAPQASELLFTLYDRTDELRIQREAIAREKLATAGEIASGVAHEVNNPLAAIRIEAELIATGTADEATADSARAIIKEVDRASRIARALIHLTRRADRELQDIQVNDLIQEIIDLRSQLDHWMDIDLRTSLDPDLPSITGPRTDLRQVIFNLITNAEDAVQHTDGAIIEVTTSRTEGGIRIRVSDSGGGISAELQQRIFDPFFTTKDPDKGMGLGLSMSHGVVAELDGKIWVEESPFGGAQFVVDLPSDSGS